MDIVLGSDVDIPSSASLKNHKRLTHLLCKCRNILPVILITTSIMLSLSRSSSWRSLTTPVFRSTEKTGPDML